MNDMKLYAVFAETVAAGSMSAAARRLGMTPSAVSQTIRALELHAGVALLHRSTRKLTLTEAGERCYPHCLRLLDAARAASESLVNARDAPTGELRIASPVGFATHITSALAPLLAQSSKLRLRLLVDDAMIDLIDARIDIAIRVGRLADSSWVARPLCDIEMILCAAPSYIERRGAPFSPDDLIGHQWLASERDVRDVQATVERMPSLALHLKNSSGDDQRVDADVRMTSNNQIAIQQMCEQGLGLARLAYADAMSSLASGALVRLLPQWRFSPMSVAAMTQGRDGGPAKVRAALEALKQYFATLPGIAPMGGV
jgi:DNA-binding transcriptional LysR family regulator